MKKTEVACVCMYKAQATYSFVEQVVRLFLFKEGFLDTRELFEVQEFARQFVSYV